MGISFHATSDVIGSYATVRVICETLMLYWQGTRCPEDFIFPGEWDRQRFLYKSPKVLEHAQRQTWRRKSAITYRETLVCKPSAGFASIVRQSVGMPSALCRREASRLRARLRR